MARKSDHDGLRLDEAARAGWLYYVAGNTQDEIARKLGISRQAAQRLVSLAISERLIKVRLDHPIARCMELAAALKLRYDLQVLRSRADRSGLDVVDARHRSSRGGGVRALAAPSRAGDHRHRHGPHDARRRRPIAGDGMPATQAGRAGRHHQDRWFGFVLRRHHSRFRQRARAALSDAAAGHRALGRGARAPDQPRLGEEPFRPRRTHRRQFRRRRRGRRLGGPGAGRHHHPPGSRGSAPSSARSGRSPAGRSTRRARCSRKGRTSASPRRRCDAPTIGL